MRIRKKKGRTDILAEERDKHNRTRDKAQSSVWTVGAVLFARCRYFSLRLLLLLFILSHLLIRHVRREMEARRGEASMETRASRTVIKRKRVVKSSSHSFQPQSPAVRAGGPCRRSANRERENWPSRIRPVLPAIGDILSPVRVNITSFFAAIRERCRDTERTRV